MIEPVLLDTGPLVAALFRGDSNHQVCTAQLRRLTRPPITCWPVLTEAVWLLRPAGGALRSLFSMIELGALRIAAVGEEACPYLAEFMARYGASGPDLADAMLMYLAEREGIDTVFTLDRRDFSVYRTSNGRALTIVPAI